MQYKSDILLSTAYLPPISYVSRLIRGNRIIFDHHAHYIKQTYRNRCRIATSNGMLELYIPVIKTTGNHTKLKDIRIAYTEKWQLIHLRAMKAAYSNAPYYMYYKEELESIMAIKYERLVDFNGALLEKLFEFLRFDLRMEFSNNYIDQPDPGVEDLRKAFSPKKKPLIQQAEYPQVFADKVGFIPELSIVDLLFNLGPDASAYLKNL